MGPYDSPARKRLHDDDQLEQLIAESIGTHPGFFGALILIEVEHGFATLTGIVRTELDRRRADLLARAHGAIGVNNRLLLESDMGRQTI